MSERFDEEVEKVLIFGQDPKERLDELTRLQPVKEGSRCTNDPLQIALAQYARAIARNGKAFQLLGRKCDVEPD